MVFCLNGCYKADVKNNIQTDKFVYWACGPSDSENTQLTAINSNSFSTMVLTTEKGQTSYEVTASPDGEDFYYTIRLPFYNCNNILSVSVEP